MTEPEEKVIMDFTRRYYNLSENETEIERYIDYCDEFPEETIEKILSSDNPRETLDETICEWDSNCEDWFYETEFKNQLETLCDEKKIDYDSAFDFVTDTFYFCYPESFLNPSFNAVITINSGDMNYDFTLHNVLNYASSYGYTQNENGTLDSKAGLYFLAKQQRRLTLLQKEIKKSDGHSNGNCKISPFVSSCITELVNLPTHMSTLSFLVQINLNDAITILETKEKHSKDYDVYNPQNTKGYPFGYIVLDKKTMCGLYDSWNGSGSVLEIELEKDVKIPLHYINSIETDKRIDDVYGLTQSCWNGNVKKIA